MRSFTGQENPDVDIPCIETDINSEPALDRPMERVRSQHLMVSLPSMYHLGLRQSLIEGIQEVADV